MKKILFGYAFPQGEFEILENAGFELIFPISGNMSKDEILKHITDCDIFVPGFSIKTDKEIIAAGKKLKLIANYGVGYDSIDIGAATKQGVVVTNTPYSVLEPTAELCFALMLAACRRIGFYNNKLHSKERLGWGIFDHLGIPLYGQTLGIYGMGRIGQAVARRALASGMKIVYHNRNRLPIDIESKYKARYVDMNTLIKESDIISLNAPATPETFHLFGKSEFERMKDTAVLVNTARGSLIDEEALAYALKNKIIYAAGLDVFESEPKIHPDLIGLDNVVLSPHAGTATQATREDMQAEVVNNIIGFFEGKKISRVNL